MNKLTIAGIAGAATLLLSCAFGNATLGGVEVGDQVSFKFRKPLEMGMGLSALSDLHGKPVIVEFWGTQ